MASEIMHFPNKNKRMEVFSIFVTVTNDALTILMLY